MRYKANFGPLEILCPFTYTYLDFDERIQKILDEKR